MTEVASVVLFSDDPVRTGAFYRALGVDLEDEHHDGGSVHAAADLGGVHVAVGSGSGNAGSGVPTPGWRASGSTFVGFYVASLDEAVVSVRALGSKMLIGHEVCEWGCRAIAEDPDGRLSR